MAPQLIDESGGRDSTYAERPGDSGRRLGERRSWFTADECAPG